MYDRKVIPLDNGALGSSVAGSVEQEEKKISCYYVISRKLVKLKTSATTFIHTIQIEEKKSIEHKIIEDM